MSFIGVTYKNMGEELFIGEEIIQRQLYHQSPPQQMRHLTKVCNLEHPVGSTVNWSVSFPGASSDLTFFQATRWLFASFRYWSGFSLLCNLDSWEWLSAIFYCLLLGERGPVNLLSFRDLGSCLELFTFLLQEQICRMECLYLGGNCPYNL